MPIYATASDSAPKELVPAGVHVATCYQMLELGTLEDNFNGEIKRKKKVRIGWEIPGELRTFDEAKGPQPMVISKKFTLSMHEKAGLRAILTSWRGAPFTEEQARKFDITNLLGKSCQLNIVHEAGKDGNVYASIKSIIPIPKGMTPPAQINPNKVLSFDEFDYGLFESLPDFIKDDIRSSPEYRAMTNPGESHDPAPQMAGAMAGDDDLPF